jgi:hypothetical protein
MNTGIESKISVLNDTSIKIFGTDLNLARIKFISLFIIALTKVQTVTFEKIAVAFENEAHTLLSLHRIQRFMAGDILNSDIIARLILALLPHKSFFRFVLDRTNRKFGNKNINILVLAVVYQGKLLFFAGEATLFWQCRNYRFPVFRYGHRGDWRRVW